MKFAWLAPAAAADFPPSKDFTEIQRRKQSAPRLSEVGNHAGTVTA